MMYTNILKYCLVLLMALGMGVGYGQVDPDQFNSANGWHITPEGRFHVLVVFAEIDFDSTFGHLDPVHSKGGWKWPSHRLPDWRDDLFSGDSSGDGLMTKYFRQASFGKFQVTGDYLDTLIKVPITHIRNRRGQVVTQEAFGNNLYKKAVLDKVNAIPNPKFRFGSEMSDFDRWSFKGTGIRNEEQPNGKIDMVMLIWRNIHVANLGNHSGFVSPGNFGTVLGQETDMYSIFRTSDVLPEVICRHEFSHMLYGGNNFHTANGGVGSRMFIPTVGGYSNMSASDALSRTWNGWDRERMNWKNPSNPYLINTACAESGRFVSGELDYGDQLCGDGIYILRDFVSTGDVIKIKLPHLPEVARSQYLWLENHQILDGYYDHDTLDEPGLYAYIQVGKDQKEGKYIFGDNCNYLWPLAAHGNYDFRLTGPKKRVLNLEQSRMNPFTGYNYLMRIVSDKNNDGKIRITTDVRPKTEYTLPNRLVCEGDTMPESFFSYQEYPIFGTDFVPFTPNRYPKMGLGNNPAAVPVYTFSGPRGPDKKDNRRIYLNGISVEVLDIGPNRELKVRIRWDDFDVDNHVRWCGNILSKEQINIRAGASVTLDQGETPQLAKTVQVIDGEKMFAEPTILELDSGSTLNIARFGKLWVQPGSTLLIRKGAKVIMEKYGSIEVLNGAYIRVEEGATLEMHPRKGGINMMNGAIEGINPLLEEEFKELVD